MPVAEEDHVAAEAVKEASDSAAPLADDPPVSSGFPEVDNDPVSSKEEVASERVDASGIDAAAKDVDESATEKIAQPEMPQVGEEIEGPEVTSDRLEAAAGDVKEENAEKDEEEEEEEKIANGGDVIGALYDRVSSAVASAHSNGKKDKDDGHKDPLLDSVMSVASPFVEFAVAQAQFLTNGVSETTDLAVRAACNQLGELQDSSTTQYYYAKDMFWRFRREYRHYENTFFSTLKDGVKTATATPGMAALVATGAAFVLLRRPRRLLFKYTLGRFRSQEAMTASAQRKVVELRESLEVQKNEKRKLEERFRLAEEEFLRGQSKMSNAGGQIRSLVKGLYKTENNAQGLLEKLRDMSGKPAFHLRAEVASMASEAKSHRSALDRNLYKIADHNIRV